MDDLRVGRICRALRRQKNWRQIDLAARVGCHQTTISRIERGHASEVQLGLIRRLFAALGASFDGDVRWRAGDLDRLLDERHAAVVGAATRILMGAGWEVAPEVTYSEWGERGSIDLLAGHAASRSVAVLEIKTDIPKVEETVRRHDEKTRLASKLAERRFGWRPEVVSRVLVLPEEVTLRRTIQRHEATFRAAYPMTSRDVRRWLRLPSGPASGVWFLSVKRPSLGSRGSGGPRRVRRPKAAAA
ncbi:MAG TPA: helix-turn-helix transcriptional regulator [Candidatus Limnocylindrales bacterium]